MFVLNSTPVSTSDAIMWPKTRLYFFKFNFLNQAQGAFRDDHY